jgi:catechol 2,3-dioxygenase-like lactoylglutathione lyase family enzyme
VAEAAYGVRMITNVSLVTVYCLDQDIARDFYVDVLGFQPRADITTGEGFRWVTVCAPGHPELELTLMTPGPPLDTESAAFIRRQLEKGQMGGLGLRVDDCRRTYAELKACGVTFLQEPAARPYGVEAVLRDTSGNWLVLIEPTEFTPEDVTPATDRELSRLSKSVIPDQDRS